jgi:hypothetical protein
MVRHRLQAAIHAGRSQEGSMCWNGQASAVLAMAGLGTTAYAAFRKEPAAIWMPRGYFSLMEVLQAVWCLFSIGLLTIAVKTPVRRILYVR